MIHLWTVIFEFLLVLGAAFVFGALAERFRQSAILGYLVAGALLGPLLFQSRIIIGIAELGVALLLFSIGLEFSFKRLRRMGTVAVGGGNLQVLASLLAFAAVIALFLPWKEAVALGGILALSSTAVVLRILNDRVEMDSVHGRNAVGILLIQDVNVIPLVLLMTILGSQGGLADVAVHVIRTVAVLIGLGALFYGLFYLLMPRLLLAGSVRGNRELIHLLTLMAAVGSAWLSHYFGLSPALGAFLAGMLLGESRFAVQVRADIGPVRTLFVTLFFTSIGMLADPKWILQHLPLLAAGVVLVILGKTVVTYLVVRLFRNNRLDALATGVTLAQIGEFSFVLATTALGQGLIDEETFAFVSSATILSLFASPYLVANARPISEAVVRTLFRSVVAETAKPSGRQGASEEPIMIIGFGPAGREVAEALIERGQKAKVLERNPDSADLARRMGLRTYVGDATQGMVLEHTGVVVAGIVVVTVPDPRTSRMIVECVRTAAPEAVLIVRARYNILKDDLRQAGATTVVDEETEVGRRLASEVLDILEETDEG